MTKKKWIFLGITAILLLLTICCVWSTFALETNSFTVTAKELPPGFDGFRIAHISDLHNEEFGKDNKQLLEAISKADPDIIVITGDLIDSYNTNVEISAAFMEKAVTIAPCYYVRGNHENRLPTQYEQLRSRMEACGVTILEDQAVTLERNGDVINIAGLMDYASLSFEYLSATFPAECFTLLLTHRPEHFEIYTKADMDLILAGHAHGGQFRLPFIGALYLPNQGLFPKYVAGMYTEDASTMVVSRGLGNSSIPFRFNNPPELVIIELHCE